MKGRLNVESVFYLFMQYEPCSMMHLWLR